MNWSHIKYNAKGKFIFDINLLTNNSKSVHSHKKYVVIHYYDQTYAKIICTPMSF